MLFYLLSRIFSSVLTHLYPAYLSYKLLATRPTPLPLLERALKYWTVLGTFTFIEYSGVELLVSWIPLYYLFKLIVLLWLVSPQTDGSTHVYDQVLEPWFSSHENEVDGALNQIRSKVYEFVQTRLRALWEMLLSSTALGQAFPQGVSSQSELPAQPPTMADPVSGPAQMAAGLWYSYGPAVLATGASIFRQLAPAAPPPAGGARSTTSTLTGYDLGEEDRPVSSRMSSTQSVIERRRQLEAELAALPLTSETPPPFPVPSIPGMPTTTLFPSGSSSSLAAISSAANAAGGSLRERTASNASPGGRFEEIDSDDLDSQDGDGVGHSYERPEAQSRKSWFGWSSGSGGYDRVKND